MKRNFKTKLKWIGLLIYPFFVLTQKPVFSQTSISKAYQFTLDLKFEESRKALEQGLDSSIPHLDLYIANLNEILELFFSEDKERYDELSPNEKKRIRILDDYGYDNPYIRFFRAEIKLQWAFLKLKFGEQWSAAWSLRKAYKTIKRNIRQHPEFALNQKSLGLLHIIFGAVPSRYQWALGLFGLEGDVLAGLDELTKVKDTGSIFGLETRLTMSIVYSYLMEDHKKALELVQNASSSLTQEYLSLLILMKAHESMIARSLLEKQSDKPAIYWYLIGETHFQQGNYPEAIRNYNYFLEQFEGFNNVKDAYFKIGLCYLFQNQVSRFEDFRVSARQSGKDWSEVDKNAASQLESALSENRDLLQLRYAIDGGFLERADSLVASLSKTSLEHYDDIEFQYRKARLAHIRKDIETAISGYSEIIKSDNLLPENYFAPNSLLQLGYIYLEKNEPTKAQMYLERVLKFRKHPYKNSLDSKAKIALARIR